MFTFLRNRVLYDCEVLFLCSSAIDEVWIRSSLDACINKGLRVALAVCSCDENEVRYLRRIYRDKRVDLYVPTTFAMASKLRSGVTVTASSGLDRTIFPSSTQLFIHMPHSLASLHAIYPEGAFDGYDVLFACGPHHVREFKSLMEAKGLSDKSVYEVGYGKHDLLVDEYSRVNRQSEATSKPHVLLAPSWGKGNLIERFGLSLVTALEGAGYTVSVRPHPLFIIECDVGTDKIRDYCLSSPNCNFESPLDGDAAIYSADVLVGDYSGASFEFFALRAKPVVSVDVERKVVNGSWNKIGWEPAEIELRNSIGTVVGPELGKILEGVNSSLNFAQKGPSFNSTVKQFLFSRGDTCGEQAASILKNMVR